MPKLCINPAVSYLEKNGVYVFYFDFNYWFFSDMAGKLMKSLLNSLSQDKNPVDLPDAFLDYCKSKNIILEVT